MTPLLLALLAGTGVYLVVTPSRAHKSTASSALSSYSERFTDWSAQAGITESGRRRVLGFVVASFIGGVLLGWVIFGGVLVPLISGVALATAPIASARQRRVRRRNEAADAWPRMIEEIRLLCGSLGRPIPQALLEVGKRGPTDLRPAFINAEREWMMSTDFNRTIVVLKNALADPTADVTCETLLVAHTLGGTDVDKRLAALAEDRQADLRDRKDARAKQAGVRFARRFVLIVPIGMALAGMSIGDGRSAYSTPQGQLGVTFAIVVLATCWWWAGRLMQIPSEERVLR